MAKKVKSLREQMAELSNVAPGGKCCFCEKVYSLKLIRLCSDPTVDADLDLEDADAFDAMRNNGEGSDEDLEDEARNHARHTYADMAPSKLRKRTNHLEGVDADQMKKYEGVKSTRKEMMSETEGDESIAGSENDDDVDLGSEIMEEENEESGSESEQIKAKPSKENRVRFEAQEDSSAARLNAAQSDAKMLQDLRKRSREDAEKGRDARIQMDLWSRLLGGRIRGQKVVRGAGRIPSVTIKERLPQMEEADRKAYDSTLSALDELSGHLFQLQEGLLQSFTNTGSSERDLVTDGLSVLQSQLEEATHPGAVSRPDKHISTLLSLDETIFEPLWRGVLARWTSRTSATGLESGQKNKFESSLKAMNQSAEDQIDRGLNGDTYERLRKRTRVWRGTEQGSRIFRAQNVAEEGKDGSDDEERRVEEEADIFDDSDFYQAMLRELIDSRGGVSSTMGADGTDSSLAWAQAAKRAAKKNKTADLRASKGRKLRYDVLEKVEHFMPPVPRETWSQDQVDRLFRQLKQSSQSSADTEKDDNGVVEGEKVDLGGLRLFG
jgi:protein AATF/BFR2